MAGKCSNILWKFKILPEPGWLLVLHKFSTHCCHLNVFPLASNKPPIISESLQSLKGCWPAAHTPFWWNVSTGWFSSTSKTPSQASLDPHQFAFTAKKTKTKNPQNYKNTKCAISIAAPLHIPQSVFTHSENNTYTPPPPRNRPTWHSGLM